MIPPLDQSLLRQMARERCNFASQFQMWPFRLGKLAFFEAPVQTGEKSCITFGSTKVPFGEDFLVTLPPGELPLIRYVRSASLETQCPASVYAMGPGGIYLVGTSLWPHLWPHVRKAEKKENAQSKKMKIGMVRSKKVFFGCDSHIPTPRAPQET